MDAFDLCPRHKRSKGIKPPSSVFLAALLKERFESPSGNLLPSALVLLPCSTLNSVIDNRLSETLMLNTNPWILAELTARISFFILVISISLPAIALPSTEFELPVCYLETEDGQIYNLSQLCNNSNGENTTKTTDFKRLITTKQCSNCTLQGANLSGINLASTALSFADLKGANLKNTNLSNANLFGANLMDADLTGANLRGANLRGVILKGAKLQGAIMPDGTMR